jgi:PhnB protein
MPKVKPIPDGYHAVTPYLAINGGANAIDFYKRAFGATERMRMAQPDGRIGHAELQIGDSCIMLADEFPDMKFHSPAKYGGTPVTLHVYVDDCDAIVNQAVAAGAKIVHPIKNQFYGDRSGTISDPFGHVWHISTHVEDVSPEEMKKRAAAQHQKQ